MRNGWKRRAKCQDVNPDIFYPEDDITNSNKREAKKICKSCPVRAECIISATENQEQWGIWGGYLREARLKLIRDLKKEYKTDTVTPEIVNDWLAKRNQTVQIDQKQVDVVQKYV